MRRALLSVATLLIAAPSVVAQAPVVGPDGDPSVQDDTIYALAVDPADHPEESVVLLLDDGILVRDEDGTGTRTYRQVAQILRRDGVSAWAEHTWGYDANRESFRLNWARVLDLDGNVISEEPIHQQIMDLPVPQQSPVYTDRKQVRVSLGSVEPGTIVDFSYTVETEQPALEGDFFSNWIVTPGSTIRRSRLILDVPAEAEFRTVEKHLDFEPRTREVNGRRVTEWFTTDIEVDLSEPELFADLTDTPDVQRLAVGGPLLWSDVGAWYASLAEGRYDVDGEVLEAARREVGDAETPSDRLAALHRWITQDFRYISISLGQGGYQPRTPVEVFRTRSGDCKDKATLFIALARAMGFEAYPVLLSSVGGVEESLPTVQQFDHAIAAVRGEDGWTFLDLTAEIIPYGHISPGYQGEFGLVVFDDGQVEQVTFPETPVEANRTESSFEGELTEDGRFTGWFTERMTGVFQYPVQAMLRAVKKGEVTDRQLDLMADGVASGLMDGASGDSLELSDEGDGEATSMRIKLNNPRVARKAGASDDHILTLPLGPVSDQAILTRLEENLDDRRHPIDVEQVFGAGVQVTSVDVTLPPGWEVDLPPDVAVESRFGTYRSEYLQEGRTLRVTRTVSGRRGTEPPEALPDLVDFLRKVSEDDARLLMIRTGR